jgi:RHS repeat-associated protein
VAAAIAQANPLRYAGCCYDGFSGLYCCSQRYYDPATASFITKDPAKADGEGSAYQYCGGDPVGKVDPSGLRIWKTGWHLKVCRITILRVALDYNTTLTAFVLLSKVFEKAPPTLSGPVFWWVYMRITHEKWRDIYKDGDLSHREQSSVRLYRSYRVVVWGEMDALRTTRQQAIAKAVSCHRNDDRYGPMIIERGAFQ